MNLHPQSNQAMDEDETKIRILQQDAMNLPDLNIVVSGLAGRFPKADSINEFEANLYSGMDMVNDNDESRFSCNLWGLPPRAGRIKDLGKFDNKFFGFTTEEANYIDFQLRLLYEVVYESILDAGMNPATMRGSNTGVFFGLHCNEFENAMADDPNFKSNGYYAQFAVRVAQYFDFRGITLTFDAACASGFVGLHSAVQALNDNLIDQAIVCSSNIPIHPTGSFIFLQMQMLSPTGYSRFLDSRADGYVKSEAVVSVLLQRKTVAYRNYASILATMTSVDGFKPEGITFPSDRSQEDLIRKTKQLAGVSVNHVEYLEAHGTGTPAGDPQEASAIANVYHPAVAIAKEADLEHPDEELNSEERRVIGPLLVGSVKTNMGHSEAASGLCALSKVVLMLENELIYKNLHFEQPNTNIEPLMSGKLKFVDEMVKLNAKIIPLSCYGFGGSNVHAILRANERDVAGQEQASLPSLPRLIIMFGRSIEGLREFFDDLLNSTGNRQLKNCLSEDFLVLLDRLSSNKIDRLMNHRGFVLVDMNEKRMLHSKIQRCDLFQADPLGTVDTGRPSHYQEIRERRVNLILPGLGCQWTSMAKGLENFSLFWSTIERLDELLDPFRDDVDLLKLFNGPSSTESDTLIVKFVSIVAYELALINIIKKLKLNNMDKIVGHSLGEVSCAYAVELLNEREAIMVAYRMGKTLERNKNLIAGKMIAIDVSEPEALALISPFESIRISCVNGLKSVTVSGFREEVDELCKFLEANRKDVMIFQVEDSIALHNEFIMNNDIKLLLKESICQVLFPLSDDYDKSRTANWISCLETNDESIKKKADASYFAECLCNKVNFLAAIEGLDADSIVMELSPSNLFEYQIRQDRKDLHYVNLMKKRLEPEKQIEHLLQQVGQLYLLGATFNLTNLYHSEVEGESLFPVRRQTPSISSLIRWSHENNLFVPKYPIQFSKSSAKCEVPIDIVQDRDKYIIGHCIEGRILYPATGYLFLIWRVFSFIKKKIYDACFQSVENELVPIEFHNVRLTRAVILSQQRSCQIYVHFEEATGKFEVKEGGSTVCEGYARSPEEKPYGLLYESIRQKIEGENLTLELNSDDIYKQFRVSGYDYGETFQNILESSANGKYSRIKFNGYFVSLTDSILQTIFLAVSQYAPSGGLFLPTKFDYVRFQPRIILQKLRQLNLVLDKSENCLNTKAKREIMTKIMQREAGKEVETEAVEAEQDESEQQQQEEKIDCIFDTYCDPITGIIVTDGIEMRGIKATPAPRRDTSNEVLLESYQFVRDEEISVVDEALTNYNKLVKPYAEACDLESRILLNRFGLVPFELNESKMRKLLRYKEKNLSCLFLLESENCHDEDKKENQDDYDIKKNEHFVLLSILDQLNQTANSTEMIKSTINSNKSILMQRDLLSASFYQSERIMRPIVELVLENCCQKRKKLRTLEVNLDDGLMNNSLQSLLYNIEPGVSLDYSLAHPDADRLSSDQLPSSIRTFKLDERLDLQPLFTNNQFGDLDLVIYKDISCYYLAKQVIAIDPARLSTNLYVLNNSLNNDCFLMILMRQKLTDSEATLLALAEPDMDGLSSEDVRIIGSPRSRVLDRVRHINTMLNKRCKLMMDETERNGMLLVNKKGDKSGNLILLYKTNRDIRNKEIIKDEQDKKNIVLLRIKHDNSHDIDCWLNNLKKLFNEQENDKANATVWLCAVATKQCKTSGLVGMMNALLKEFGSTRLRCYCDLHTFADRDDSSIELEDIEACENFQRSLKRNLLWNCIDEANNFGAYRHFTANDFMSYEGCLCDRQESKFNHKEFGTSRGRQVNGAYVNNAKKGDLSSFTWFEAPFKYLAPADQKNLIRVAYSALNFRDVMLSTGRLPLDAIPIRLATCDCLLGLEFSGFDYSNKRVMGMVFGRGLASHVICPERTSIKLEIPDYLSLREAATIPVVYSTAIMALIYRGRMQKGESILIHAGSGGVGQAAIRLAAHYEMEIYTTVGSDEKRQFLLDEFGTFLKEERIFSSRDCEFENSLMRLTRGRGVDLVLNSLADDKLQASLRCLADGGRFLEIGKYDISLDNRLELLKLDTNKTFHGILLDKLFDTDDISEQFLNQLKCVLNTLRDGLDKGYVKPIKYKLFERNQIEEAFRYMATGKHIGKVLIEIDESLENGWTRNAPELPKCLPLERVEIDCVPRFQLAAGKSYIITGGLGGFGLELIKWLVGLGAKRVLITSRQGVRTGYQKSILSRLSKTSGAQFRIITYDTTTREGVQRLLMEAKEFSLDKAQIGAIFHLAMVLKDSMIENMTAEDFQIVCRPKLNTFEHLDKLTREHDLNPDYFVAFSSVTSGKGNAGQANYAYANSCLERICERRRHKFGHHALAIQWGAIGDVGVAYENLGGNDIIIGGTVPQRIPSCLATLSKLLCSPFTVCLSVVPVKRASSGSGIDGNKTDLVGAIMHVLGIKDSSKVSPQASLGELGLDSLMAVEIRQFIEREYEMTLNIQEIRSLTIEKIREISNNANSVRQQHRPKQLDSNDERQAKAARPALREHESYGASDKQTANQVAAVPDTESTKANSSEAFEALLDRSMVASFVPQLELPKADFVRLNFKNIEKLWKIRQAADGGQQAATNYSNNGRPIFFIPPIHGEFHRLEVVCTTIKRPCIGLNWTRRLGTARSVGEAAEEYLDLLVRTNWLEEFYLPNSGYVDDRDKVVDLVGYSYGATIAFEMMLKIFQQRNSKRYGKLKAGRLILLDGSPKQIELGSQYMSSLTSTKKLSYEEKLNELLMVYMIAHTKRRNVNYFEIQSLLEETPLADKIPVASRKLVEILELSSQDSCNGSEDNTTESSGNSSGSEEGGSDNSSQACSKQLAVAQAMEAFCRRYELISKYKLSSKLPADCTLIRAEKLYLQRQVREDAKASEEHDFNEDLDLSSAVRGKVELFIMRGDHETFLNKNHREIGQIITKHCSLN